MNDLANAIPDPSRDGANPRCSFHLVVRRTIGDVEGEAAQEPREILDPELRERMEAPSVVGEEDIVRKETGSPAGFEQIDEGDHRLGPVTASRVADATEVRGRTSFEIAGEPRDRGRQFRPERGRVNLEAVLVVENRKDRPIPEARHGIDVGEPLVEGSFAAD